MRITRPAFLALIFATATLLALAPSRARADFDYTYALSGTITEVNDLSAFHQPLDPLFGQQVHLLPGLSVGDPITVSGVYNVNEQGYYDASMAVNAPDNFRFAVENIFGFSSFDPSQPDLGFVVQFRGLIESEHPAVFPHRSTFDFITDALIVGPDFTVNVHHNSFLISPLDAVVRATFTTRTVTPVPEPASLALLLIGVTGVGLAARRTLAARPGA